MYIRNFLGKWLYLYICIQANFEACLYLYIVYKILGPLVYLYTFEKSQPDTSLPNLCWGPPAGGPSRGRWGDFRRPGGFYQQIDVKRSETRQISDTGLASNPTHHVLEYIDVVCMV